MKVALKAKPLAVQLSLAASLVDSKLVKKIAALEAVHLVAREGAVTITTNALDHVLTTTIPVVAVEAAAEVAVSAMRLAALAAGFPPDCEITISSDDKMASIACGRSRFKLPTLPLGDLPPTPTIDQETGRVELERSELLALLSKPAFAISAEQTRFYLNGICMHDTKDGLAAVATDGHRFARAIVPNAGRLSQDRHLIIPKPAIRILLKLLADKATEAVTLRRSKTLIEATAAGFSFVTKLIDAQYPAYERILPEPSGNAAIVGRADLRRALERIQAVAPETKAAPMVGLLWAADAPALHVCVSGRRDLADDPITAETAGNGRIAFKINHGLELLDAIKGDRVRIDSSAVPGSPIHITDPADANFLIVQMPCVWGAAASQAA
jgi:DNA polymerase-3 subunit beta